MLLNFVPFCAILSMGVAITVGGQPPRSFEEVLLCLLGEEAVQMVTYSDLFQFCLVIIGIIALFLQTKKK